MTAISSLLSTTSANTNSTSAASKKTSNDELDQSDFLRLLTTQLQNQDPTKPLDSQEFTAQMAQFSTLNVLTDIKTSMNTLVQSIQ